MRTTAHLDAPCAPDELAPWIATLDRYPAWMGLVHRAEPTGGDDARPAWDVELRTRVGPLARSKRLRMVRTASETDDRTGARRVVFEREELDGKQHAAWELVAVVEPVVEPGAASGARLTMDLAYHGRLWTGGVLQRVLDDEIRRGSERLVELVSERPTR